MYIGHLTYMFFQDLLASIVELNISPISVRLLRMRSGDIAK